jgi:hypothetical protein
MIPAEDAKRHRESIIRNPTGWANIDFERLSKDLCIEINHEMSPIIVRRVIEGRLAEMSVKEYDSVPFETWDYLASIKALGKFEAIHKTYNRSTLFPMKLKKLSKDTLSISPVGSSVLSMFDTLSENDAWGVMHKTIDANVVLDQGGITIKSRSFYPWNEKQLVEVFRAIDKASTLPVATYI